MAKLSKLVKERKTTVGVFLDRVPSAATSTLEVERYNSDSKTENRIKKVK